jgi:hypothetical protein
LYNKGQIFSFDFIIAMGIFLVILLSFFSIWNVYNDVKVDMEQKVNLARVAESAMQSLMLTGGNPPNWYNYTNYNEIVSIGLRNGDVYELAEDKVIGLETANVSYKNMTKALGISKYEVSIIVKNGTGDLYKFGVLPPFNPKEVVSLSRLGILNNEPVEVVMKVWI